MNKHPYFFRYLYKEADREYRDYYKRCDNICQYKFNMNLKSLLGCQKQTEEISEFIDNYYKYMPLIYSDSSMNLVCRYLENFKFDILKKMKIDNTNDYYYLYRNNNIQYSDKLYNKVKRIIMNYIAQYTHQTSISKATFNDCNIMANNNEDIKMELSTVAERDIIVNILVDYFYLEKQSSNKDILWELYGDAILNNVKLNTKDSILFPFPDECGNIKYMGKQYAWKEVSL